MSWTAWNNLSPRLWVNTRTTPTAAARASNVRPGGFPGTARIFASGRLHIGTISLGRKQSGDRAHGMGRPVSHELCFCSLRVAMVRR